MFFIVDFGLRTGRAEMRTRSFFLSQNWRFFVAKTAFLQDVNCKTLQKYAKKCKNLQENLHISKKSCNFAPDFGREPKRTPKS